MPQDIRPSGYFPQGTFIIPATQIERQRKLAAELAKAGGSGPVQHWSQGAARIVNALGSVLQEGRANEMENQRRSALAEALRGGDPEAMIRSGEPDLQQVGQFLYQQRQQQAQAARQAEMDARAEEHFQANFKQNADQFAATQERLNQPNFTPGTPDQQEIYGPEFLGMGQNGPIFKPSSVARSPWETRLLTNPDGSTTPTQINRDTGESRPVQSTAPPANPNAALPVPKLTEGEQKSFRFYRRARNANNALSPAEEEALASGAQNTVGWVQGALEKVPYAGEGLAGVANAAHSDAYQNAKIHADRIIASLNYSDSGAQINKDEYTRQWNSLIPVFGNGPEAIAAKRKARADALSSLKATVGRGVPTLDREEQAYAEARNAIKSGRDPAAVRQTLIDNGFDPGDF